MTDIRTSFAILEDSGTQAGAPLHRVFEGDAYASKNASPALVAKNGTDLVYLKTNSVTGALFVDTSGISVVCKSSAGELAAGSATLATVTGAVITLVASKAYQGIGFVVSSRRDSLFQIIWNNNGVDTILAEIVVGSGAFTVSSELHCLSFTSGATGTQELKVKAKNFEAQSSLRASITAEEVQ